MVEQSENPRPPSDGKGLIAIVRLGKVEADVLRVVADSLQGILRLPVDVWDTMPIPEDAFMRARNQYNAMVIIRYLAENHSDSSLKILGIMDKDICNPIITYVFGEAYMGGRAAVMSSARLSVTPSGEPVSRERFLDRVVKVALHEIGHTFNIPHCHSGRCVMRASNTLAELDDKLNYLCDYCEIFLVDALRHAMHDKEQESADSKHS